MNTNNKVQKGPYRVLVRIITRAKAERVMKKCLQDGTEQYKVYVNTPPEDGKANKAVLKALGKELGVPPTALAIIQGQKSTHKIIEVLIH